MFKELELLEEEIVPELDTLPERASRKDRMSLTMIARQHRKDIEEVQELHRLKEEKDRLHLLEKHETAVRHKKRRLRKLNG